MSAEALGMACGTLLEIPTLAQPGPFAVIRPYVQREVIAIAEVEHLRQRAQLEAISRLNGETIQNMQRAAEEATSAQYRVSTQNGEHTLARPVVARIEAISLWLTAQRKS